ncbi:MAG TPA: BamA/TamA family outer membrane protein [Vicinamibacteria bacterium]|nr:BamA/TamA family outer membrane protein [Vicinamibacteria bacterium]
MTKFRVGLLACVLAAPQAAGLDASGATGLDLKALAPWQGKIVRSLAFRGNNVTRENVIARELRTRVGDPLALETLAADVMRLENLAIFSGVHVEAAPDGQDGVGLAFVVKESPSWLPLVTFKYTEENGFSVGAGVTALNLAGQGMRLKGRAYVGGTTQLWVDFDWPWAYGPHGSFKATGGHRERSDLVRGFEETSDELTLESGVYLGESGRAALALSHLRMRSDTSGITLSPDNDDSLYRVGLSLGLDTRDSWRNPRSGWQNELELWRTGGDGDFWSMNLDLRRYVPTAVRQKLLLAGLLSVQSGTLGEDLPIYLDYRMGGANTIRGYDVQELGRTVSGKNQLLGTAEYSWNVMPLRRVDVSFLSFRLGVDMTVFTDAGIAWSEPREFAMNRARAGFGAGVRLLVPGSEMLRLDLGFSPEGGLRFHFGAWSKPTAARGRLR